MKFGFNLLLWTTHVTDAHAPILEGLKKAGFDGVEVPLFEGDEKHFAALRRRLDDLGLASTSVGVMGKGSAISPDKAERGKALDHMKWLSDCTAALGTDLTCGPYHQPLGVFSGAGPSDREIEDCVEVHKQAAQYAAKAGVRWSIEPLNRFECYFLNTSAQASSLVKRVAEPNYGYLYDTFHFNIEENDYVSVIGETIETINHVHISENNRGTPGTGHIDFASVFSALRRAGYDGWMTVEAFGSALPDLAAATKIWRPLFNSPEDVYQGAIRLMREGWAKA